MEFGKIGPWRAIRTGMWNTLFQSTPLKWSSEWPILSVAYKAYKARKMSTRFPDQNGMKKMDEKSDEKIGWKKGSSDVRSWPTDGRPVCERLCDRGRVEDEALVLIGGFGHVKPVLDGDACTENFSRDKVAKLSRFCCRRILGQHS
jgi:hypothetical protein